MKLAQTCPAMVVANVSALDCLGNPRRQRSNRTLRAISSVPKVDDWHGQPMRLDRDPRRHSRDGQLGQAELRLQGVARRMVEDDVESQG